MEMKTKANDDSPAYMPYGEGLADNVVGTHHTPHAQGRPSRAPPLAILWPYWPSDF